MNILYIAYSCSPNHGSEDRIGWKIPLASAANHRVFVLTKEEHRSEIEEYRKNHLSCQVQFYYVDIPAAYKKIFRGFSYSGRLNIWHKRALVAAEEICRREGIDLIHQITPVEFRSIGDYGRIPNVKFVCGPIGGGEYIPSGLRYYARLHALEEIFRTGINRFSLLKLRCSGVLSRCDAVLFANKETKQYLSSAMCSSKFCKCMTEIGIDSEEIAQDGEKNVADTTRNFLVAGRLIYRKGHAFLLDALKELPAEYHYTCTMLGNGPELNRLRKACKANGLECRVRFKDKVPFQEMDKIYADAHVLIMPSIRETTGSVLLEAMSRGIPIVTIDRFGGAMLLNDVSGWLYYGRTQGDFVKCLRNTLMECITEAKKVEDKGQAALQLCAKYTWDQKALCYQHIYEALISQPEDGNGKTGIGHCADL